MQQIQKTIRNYANFVVDISYREKVKLQKCLKFSRIIMQSSYHQVFCYYKYHCNQVVIIMDEKYFTKLKSFTSSQITSQKKRLFRTPLPHVTNFPKKKKVLLLDGHKFHLICKLPLTSWLREKGLIVSIRGGGLKKSLFRVTYLRTTS